MNSSKEPLINQKPLNKEISINDIGLLKPEMNKLNIHYFTYNCDKPKKILNPHGINININTDGSAKFNILNECQVKMLNHGEDIVLLKHTNLDKYIKEIYSKKVKINKFK